MSDSTPRPSGALLDSGSGHSIDELNPAPGKYLMLPGAPVDSPTVEDPSLLVAVIDSGVLRDHPQLKAWIVEEVDFTGSGVRDEVGHGTVVTLILVRTLAQGGSDSIGVLSAKVAGADGHVEQDHVIQAIHWAVEKGARAINLSLGFPGTYEENRAVCDAIAEHPDVFFSVAAGNSGPDVPVFPADCQCTNVIRVGAVDAEGTARSYSGKGDIYAPDAHTLVPESRLRYEQGQEAIRAGRREEARAHYEHAAAEGVPEAHFELALMDLKDGLHDSALNHLDKALELRPEFPEALLMVGAAWAIQGEHGKAEPFYEQSIALDPNSAMAFHNLGTTRLELGRADLALEAFERAAQLDPSYPRIDERIASAKAALKGGP